MSRPARRRRPPSPPRPPARRASARSALAELADDLAYLAFKESIGEPLSDSERERLEAARSAEPKPAGGAS